MSDEFSHSRLSLTLVVPVYNERECLPELENRLSDLHNTVRNRLDVQVILVDDGSSDESRSYIFELASRCRWVAAVALTRNFGHQAAVLAGLEKTTSEFVAILDADLQDPPELIPEMLDKLRSEELHIVYGQRVERLDESWFKLYTARLYYRLMKRISGFDFPLDTGDFRVIDRHALDTVLRLNESEKLLRGLFAWTGFASAPFPYIREPRFAGKTKYGISKMLKLALNSIISFSKSPFRVIQILGVLLVVLGLIILIVWATLLIGGHHSQLGLIASLLLICTGLTISSIGIVGGYTYRIQDQVQHRPRYVIDQTLNLV